MCTFRVQQSRWGAFPDLQVSNSGFVTLKKQIQDRTSDNERWGQRSTRSLNALWNQLCFSPHIVVAPSWRKIIFQLVFPLVLWYPNLIIQASTCSVHHTLYQSWPPEHLISYSDFVSRRTPSEGGSSILVIRWPVLASFAWVLLFSGISIHSCSNLVAVLFPYLLSARGRLAE